MATAILVSVLFLVWVEVIPVWNPISTPMELFYSQRDVYINVTISSTEPEFAERSPVTIHAFGSIGVRSVGDSGFADASVLKNVLMVCAAFSGAYPFLNGQVITDINPQPNGGVCLSITNTPPREHLAMSFGPGAYLTTEDQTVEWLSPTESIPSIIILYNGTISIDGVVRNTISQSYPEKKLQIESLNTIQSTKLYLKSPVEGMTGVVLGLVQAIPWAISKRKQSDSKSPKRSSQNRAKSRR